MSTNYSSLQASAEGGQLSLEENAAQKCAEQCAQLISELEDARFKVDNITDIENIGTLDSAAAVKNHIVKAARGGISSGSSAVSALDAYIDEVTQMMITFLKAGKAYTESESSSTLNFNHLSVSVDGKETFLSASSESGYA